MRLQSLAIVLAFCLLPGLSRAQQETGRRAFFLDAGPVFPVGADFELFGFDLYGTGFTVGGGMEWSWVEPFSLQAELDYHRMFFDEGALLDAVGVPDFLVEAEGGALNMVTLLGVLKYHLLGPDRQVRPYLLGGLGYRLLNASDLVVRDVLGIEEERIEGGTDNGVAGVLGAGLRIPVGDGVALFGEGRWLIGWDLEESLDLDESYLPLRAGVSFTR